MHFKKLKRMIHHDQVSLSEKLQVVFNIWKSISVKHHISRLKDKKYMINSIDTEIAFDKIQHHIMVKTLKTWGVEGNFLNLVKDVYEKIPQLTSYLWWKISYFPPKIRSKTKKIATSIQCSGGSSQGI